jgi:two-component system sensor histidine kinase VanS
MFFTAVIGTVVAVVLGLFLLEYVVDGLLQDPIARGFLWVAQSIFGATQEEAQQVYQHYVREQKAIWINAGVILLMLAAFYIAMGRFTAWLRQISVATRQVVTGDNEPIKLPPELAPVEEDLNEIRRILGERELAAKESEQRKDDLVAYLAHDLKTPLTSVVGYLTLLRDEPNLTPQQRSKYTHIALDKAERLEELLSEFFDITRMDFKSAADLQTPIQLSILLEQLADEFYPLFGEKNLTCHTEIPPHLVVRGDPDRLARVFDNVLRNAVSYSTPGGQVDIEARAIEGEKIEIAIRNEGLIIPEQELANIFQKFYRLDAARSSRTGGAGLGLAIAREIIALHGGSIRAESNGKRTSFLIVLPAEAGAQGDQPSA